ncbi:hypothetical protein C5B42_05675 [Candidatus Cerribacteria bacterium 'Amazon FNV 2010 28 9']|uniref:Uncharacterized protein n=1 Tax=Candidatus Cerribacteria bacterium 'Amazon FNV 2010 28 9' TaxID=2081795 RepID=A0A317JPT5_9BACT|nr:MAG: hypothetical protein C5B42_05675 [Candidatus Cerribacteria bacterium 'Amazon FNV 2010 28 9']
MKDGPTNKLAKKFFEMGGDVAGSFIQDSMQISQTEIQKIADGLDCGNISFFTPLPTRRFTFAFNKNDFQLFPGEKLPKSLPSDYKTEAEDYFIFFIQASKGSFFLVGLYFDFTNWITARASGNPFEEEDLMEDVAEEIKEKMGFKNVNYFPGNESVTMNMFELNDSLHFFAFQA